MCFIKLIFRYNIHKINEAATIILKKKWKNDNDLLKEITFKKINH